ncbi:MAG: ATP phosphoribosyltransferase regulatory subunit [Candidatus Woesearchaeota archaeon]
MNLERAKGTKDYPPEEKIMRQEVIDSLRNIFELYGFSPLETPIIERYDVLSAKYTGGAEILKETFKFKDQGGRELCLRYDLTVPFCRFIGMNPTIKMPFKRYQIGRVFRDGPIKTGRLREFWQCDVDVVGTKNMIADAEFIKIAQSFFSSIGLKVIIEINNRKLLDGLLEDLNILDDRRDDVIVAIDKLKKVPIKDIEAELAEKGVEKNKVDELFRILGTEGTNMQKLKKLRKLLKSEKAVEGLDEIEQVLNYVDESEESISKEEKSKDKKKKNQKSSKNDIIDNKSTKENNVMFSISLARGLSYYTGTVYEVFMSDDALSELNLKFKSSLAGGGRYDKMIGDFLGSNREFPAIGISFGIEPITVMINEIKKSELEKSSDDDKNNNYNKNNKDNTDKYGIGKDDKGYVKKTVTELYVIPIPFDKSARAASKVVEELRNAGLNVDMDISGKGISKNLNYANSYGIPYVLFVGEEELKKKKFKLKDMRAGKEEYLTVKGIVKRLK